MPSEFTSLIARIVAVKVCFTLFFRFLCLEDFYFSSFALAFLNYNRLPYDFATKNLLTRRLFVINEQKKHNTKLERKSFVIFAYRRSHFCSRLPLPLWCIIISYSMVCCPKNLCIVNRKSNRLPKSIDLSDTKSQYAASRIFLFFCFFFRPFSCASRGCLYTQQKKVYIFHLLHTHTETRSFCTSTIAALFYRFLAHFNFRLHK